MEKNIRTMFDPRLVTDLLKKYGITGDTIRRVSDKNNFISEVSTADGNFIVRIAHPRQKPLDALEAENHWIEWLESRGVGASPPIRSHRGNAIETVLYDGQEFYGMLYSKAAGRTYGPSDISEQLLEQWGTLVGKIHSVSAAYDPQGCRHRSDTDWHYLFLQPEKYLPPGKSAVVERIHENRKRIEKMERTDGNFNIIHYDIHPGNFVANGVGLILFDFDDCHYDFLAADLASSIFHLIDLPELYHTRKFTIARNDMLNMIKRTFIEHYNRQNRLPENVLAHLNLFLQRRAMNLYVNFYRSFDIGKLNEAHPGVLSCYERAIAEDIEIAPDDFWR